VQQRFSSQFLGMNSIVIYRGNAGYLIDPGVFPSEIERIDRFLQRQKIDNITLLLTHTHGDHISGWYFFRHFPAFGHESIAQKSKTVRENDVKYLQSMWRKRGIENTDYLIFPDNLQFVADGEVLAIPPFSFVIYQVPGHSIDMSVIIIPEQHLMFSGDMLIDVPAPFVLHSVKKYRESLKRIAALVKQYDVRYLVPGHREPAHSRQEIVKRIEKEQSYLQELVGKGIRLAEKGLDRDGLKHALYETFPQYARLHSHQVNVQTLLRELNE